MASGNTAAPYGINSEGLKRRGFSAAALAGDQARLQDAVQIRPDAGSSASDSLREQAQDSCAEIGLLADFLQGSTRGHRALT